MNSSTISLHTRFQIGQVDPRIFGGFLEHMGRAVYGGVYEPDSRHAGELGCRRDVLEALRQLRFRTMRYPGGNFASGYHWYDGVGPKERRPTIRDLAWQSTEPNHFGTDEFLTLCDTMEWQPMLTVNLGTGTPEEARNWLEYTNCPAGTKFADMRVENGRAEPYGVRLWCLGNEMDGPWQLGHVPAEQYAIRAQQAAKIMKDVDRSVELVVCGSSSPLLDTYLEWDRIVLERLGGLADYVSLHRYVGNRSGDTADFLAVTNSIDEQIEQVDAVCRYVQGKRKRRKRAYLSFDEWNVWYRTFGRPEHMDGQGKFAPHLLEEIYSLEDALVVAGFLHSFLRHADVVKIANLAQVTNVIAPVLTRGDDILIQSIYYPFAMFSRRCRGISLRTFVDGPSYVGDENGEVTFVDASSVLDGERIHVFATNRSTTSEAQLRIEVGDVDVARLVDAEMLTGPDAKAENTFESPRLVRAEPFEDVKVTKGRATLSLPPLSLAAVTLEMSI